MDVQIDSAPLKQMMSHEISSKKIKCAHWTKVITRLFYQAAKHIYTQTHSHANRRYSFYLCLNETFSFQFRSRFWLFTLTQSRNRLGFNDERFSYKKKPEIWMLKIRINLTCGFIVDRMTFILIVSVGRVKCARSAHRKNTLKFQSGFGFRLCSVPVCLSVQ